MKYLLLIVAVMTTGCIPAAKNIKDASRIKSGNGLLVVQFESSWPYENISQFGKPLSLVYKKVNTGFYDGKISFSRPPSVRIIELPEGDYSWEISAIDNRVYTEHPLTIPIRAGQVTNLGKLYLNISWVSSLGPQVYKITQTDFEEIISSSALNTDLKIANWCLEQSGHPVRMSSSLGMTFTAAYSCAQLPPAPIQ